jgi:RNA polymerase sigma-70 factor, ECF subfamily
MSFANANENRPNPKFENSKNEGAADQQPPDAASQLAAESFSNAYRKGFHLTVRFLLSRGVSNEVAWDTAQAAWTKGWERREQLRQPDLVLTWTNSIALNIYRTMLRHERQTAPLADVEASTSLNVAAIDVERILRECKPKDRIVLEEHYIAGYKTTEIAQLQGCSATTVRIRLHRARRKIQHELTRAKPQRVLALAS